MSETTIQGHRVRLLATHRAPGVLVDTWEDLGKPVGSLWRVGVVVTFRDGHDYVNGSSGVAHPFLPDPVYAAAYDDRPSRDPVERFQEALRQERERAMERLGGALHFEQRGGVG